MNSTKKKKSNQYWKTLENYFGILFQIINFSTDKSITLHLLSEIERDNSFSKVVLIQTRIEILTEKYLSTMKKNVIISRQNFTVSFIRKILQITVHTNIFQTLVFKMILGYTNLEANR